MSQNNNKRPPQTIRGVSPCKDCTEKFMACHDRCPKDARGEYGYGAWAAELKQVKKVREEYLMKASNRRKFSTYSKKGNNYVKD